MLVFPYHQDLAVLNTTLRGSNMRFVFSSRNTIGRAVVSKQSTKAGDLSQQAGVYAIDCKFPDCQRTYYGRSQEFMVRRAKHVKDYREGNEHSPLIKHIRQFPGHSFNPSDARLIWKTHSKHETQFVEAACIKRFPSCNRS